MKCQMSGNKEDKTRQKDKEKRECVRVRASYAAVVVHVDVVQPAEVLVGLQEAGQLLVLSGRLGQQLPPLPLLHVPAEQEVRKVL